MSRNSSDKTMPRGVIKFDIKLSEEQKNSKALILSKPVNFIFGKAGSGKTLLAVQVALDLFFKKEIEQIIITRPTVSTQDDGFLPGSYEEKMEPWMVPIRSNMRKVYNRPDVLEKLENNNSIELVSLAHFRGRTFENSVVIVDEFQNLTKKQLQMAIGRLGKNSTMIFCGDKHQIDLKYSNDSAVHEIPKISGSRFVNEIILKDNHRHESIDEILNLLNDYF